MAVLDKFRSYTRMMVDEFVRASKAIRLPVFTGAPTLNGAEDVPGYVGIKDGKIKVYQGGGIWADASPDGKYTGASPASQHVGGVNIGDNIADSLFSDLFQKMLAPYVPPTITCTLLTPSPAQYNAVNVVYSIAYQWAPNVGTTAFSGAQIQYKRSSDLVWINLTTAVTGSTNKIATATVTLNTGGPNNDGVDTRVIFADATQSNTSAVNTATFQTYVAPGITLSAGTATRELGNISTTVTGTITRNTPLIALTNYQVQYQVNGTGSWIDIGAPIAASGSSQAISVAHNDSALVNSTSLVYRARVLDAQTTTTSSSVTISFVYKSVLGYNSSSSISLGVLLAMGNSALTNSKARTIAGVTAASTLYTYYGYDAAAGDLALVLQDGVDSILAVFDKLTDLTGTNSFGATVTVRVYKTSAPGAFTSSSLAFS